MKDLDSGEEYSRLVRGMGGLYDPDDLPERDWSEPPNPLAEVSRQRVAPYLTDDTGRKVEEIIEYRTYWPTWEEEGVRDALVRFTNGQTVQLTFDRLYYRSTRYSGGMA